MLDKPTAELTRAFFAHGPGHLGVLDGAGRVQMCSSEALAGFDVNLTDMLGQLWWDGPWWIDDEAGRSAARALFQAAYCAGQASGPLRYRNGDGSAQWRQAHLSVESRDGTVSTVFVNCTDITNQITANRDRERALRQSRDQLREVNHRVMNTLTIVTSLIRQEMRRSDAPEAHVALKRLSHRLSAISGLYRTLSRTDISGARVDAGFYLNGVIEDIRIALAPEDPPRVRLETCVASVPVPFQTATALGLVVNELMTNSLKYAFPNGRSGLLRVSLVPEGEGLLLRVEDDGIGPSTDSTPESGIGTELVEAFASQLMGDVRRTTPPGGGYVIEVRVGAEALGDEPG